MRRRTQRGFSLVEVIVTMAIVSGMVILIYGIIDDVAQATMFNESHNDLTIYAQRAVNDIRNQVLQARQVFEEDTVGTDYRNAMDIPVTAPAWPSTRMPIVQSGSTLNPDTGTGNSRFTGNALLMVRELSPLSVMYNHDNNIITPDVEFLVDRYVFIYTFLSRNSGRSFAQTGYTADLLQSRSVPFANYVQLRNLSQQQIAAIVPLVRAAGIERALDPGQPVATAFYALAGATDGTFDPPLAQPRIAVAKTATLLPGLMGGRISGRMDYSVAFAPASPRPPFPLRHPTSIYAIPDASLPGFPSGFEVKIAGPSGNRRVLARLLLMSHYGVRHYESQQGFVTTAARF